MVKIPVSWLPSLATPAATGQQGSVAARRINATPPAAYTRTATVDLGNDGVAPTVTFANKQAWTFVGPAGWGESWALDQAYVSTSVGQLDTATCTIYAGPYMPPFQPVQQYAVAPALLGGSNQLGMGGIAIATGWYIAAYWTGGTNGATASLRLSGTKTARLT